MQVDANNITHFSIHADDTERAKAFYAAVFQWAFEPFGPPGFFVIKTGTEEKPGILGTLQQRTIKPVEAGETFIGFECSIGVADIEKTVAGIERAGGSIISPPADIPTVGKISKFLDTENNAAMVVQYTDEIRGL